MSDIADIQIDVGANLNSQNDLRSKDIKLKVYSMIKIPSGLVTWACLAGRNEYLIG